MTAALKFIGGCILFAAGTTLILFTAAVFGG